LCSNESLTSELVATPALPEPIRLYGLTVLAFLLHVDEDGICSQCHDLWPCDHLRLAYRLREAF
jgi:hypothetical protein